MTWVVLGVLVLAMALPALFIDPDDLIDDTYQGDNRPPPPPPLPPHLQQKKWTTPTPDANDAGNAPDATNAPDNS